MTCMRINCAHDDRAAWARMVEHLERARRETGKDCRLLMDLAGPKLRTGAIEPGPRLIHWQPKRDEAGRVEEPARLWLTPQESPEIAAVEPKVDAVLPLPRAWLDRLRAGDSIRYRDVRGKSGAAAVVERLGSSWLAESTSLTYLGTECSLRVKRRGLKRGDASLPEDILPTGILPLSQSIRLFPGETLRLTRDPEPARPDQRDAGGRLLEEPRIACTLPEVFAFVRPGERACFDDGKIGAVVLSSSPEELRLEITHPFEGKKLRADKGINFPDSKFALPALTAKDLEDLDFIVQHADMVGLSFINRPEDVEDLDRELARRTTRKLGRVLKIETRRAFEQLPRIILRALRDDRVGVMIARGDLAVECGYERLAELQEEILWICEAAHVPVIWATQVLETLNKKGLPSRAEVTDAAMGERAECVMLNKGPHVVETVKMLGDILARMQGHQEKKTPMLRALGISGMREGG
jgi:pyruvate kinase